MRSESDPTPATSDTDRTLIRRFRDGEQDAASAIYLRYARRLQSLAHQQTSTDLSRRLASEEIVQSVFRTFFRRVSDGQYEDVSGDDLWRLFLVIALNKIRSAAEFHRAQKRDVRRTTSGGMELNHRAAAQDGSDDVAVSVLRLTIDELLQDLPENHHEIIRLRIEGNSVAEISEHTGRALRTTERILQSFRQRLMEHIQD